MPASACLQIINDLQFNPLKTERLYRLASQCDRDPDTPRNRAVLTRLRLIAELLETL